MSILVLMLTCVVLTASPAYADPSPPPPPECDVCQGPPPPPTPVPTVNPTQVAPQAVVEVHLAKMKISRGQKDEIAIEAATDSGVIIRVRYSHGTGINFRLKMGSTGQLQKAWTVSQTAATGRGHVVVTVWVDGEKVSKKFALDVTS
ncbi:MAG: hypothetical protein ACR2GA_07365 [Chloroflexota bacterium]